MGAALGAIEPHLHILALGVVVQQPAHLQDQRGAVLKAHKGRGKVLDVKLGGDRPAPDAKRALLGGPARRGRRRSRHRLGVAHQPQRQVQDVHADVDARAAAAVLFQDKSGPGGRGRAAQHPTAGVIDVAQRAGVDLGFHRLGRAAKAKVLRRHQHLARGVARGDHVVESPPGVGARGFSQITCLPASSAAMLKGA